MPLKFCWVATVHKAQAPTLDKVIILSLHEFTGGLLYTALSRVNQLITYKCWGFGCGHVSKQDNVPNDIRELPHRSLEIDPVLRIDWQAITTT